MDLLTDGDADELGEPKKAEIISRNVLIERTGALLPVLKPRFYCYI